MNLKTTVAIVSAGLILALSTHNSNAQELASQQSAPSQQQPLYDGSWEALQKMPVPAWFDDGKIGIFIHWGPYSVIGYRKGGRGYAEHVPKMMYRDAEHYFALIEKRLSLIHI